jgi:hypothetical protein
VTEMALWEDKKRDEFPCPSLGCSTPCANVGAPRFADFHHLQEAVEEYTPIHNGLPA